MSTKHKITTEIHQTATWSAPEGGPEVVITFSYQRATRDVWSGPMACPAQPESVEFIEARYAHDDSLLSGTWEDWARDWLSDHEDEAADRAWSDMDGERERAQDMGMKA